MSLSPQGRLLQESDVSALIFAKPNADNFEVEISPVPVPDKTFKEFEARGFYYAGVIGYLDGCPRTVPACIEATPCMRLAVPAFMKWAEPELKARMARYELAARAVERVQGLN
jgi:hypothetical protein